jgi:hypothetical protein
MDYRKFLGKKESLVLPYFGGAFVDAPNRRLRAARKESLRPGWWRFEVSGRQATPSDEPAEPDLDALARLPGVRGHLLGDRLVREGAIAEQVHFLPADEPMRFSPIRARRWPTGPLVFESTEFETEAEEIARRAFEDGKSLGGERAIPATLRAAFGYAIALDVARRRGVEVSPAELIGSVLELSEAQEGRALAEGLIERIVRAREEHDRAAAERRRVAEAREAARHVPAHTEAEIEARCDAALRSAGANLVDLRRLDGGLAEVTYRFMGERFLTIVDRRSLQVIDAGICLAGHDDLVTLESLPAVLRQAIREGRLVIARHHQDDPRGRFHHERANVEDPDA